MLADPFRVHGSEPFIPYNQNNAQSTQIPDLYSSESINHKLNTYGFMHEQQNFQAKQNQLDFMGDSTGVVPHNLMSRGLSLLSRSIFRVYFLLCLTGDTRNPLTLLGFLYIYIYLC